MHRKLIRFEKEEEEEKRNKENFSFAIENALAGNGKILSGLFVSSLGGRGRRGKKFSVHPFPSSPPSYLVGCWKLSSSLDLSLVLLPQATKSARCLAHIHCAIPYRSFEEGGGGFVERLREEGGDEKGREGPKVKVDKEPNKQKKGGENFS